MLNHLQNPNHIDIERTSCGYAAMSRRLHKVPSANIVDFTNTSDNMSPPFIQYKVLEVSKHSRSHSRTELKISGPNRMISFSTKSFNCDRLCQISWTVNITLF